MIGRIVLGIGCAYEIVALSYRPIPTITEIVQTVSRHTVGRFVLWLWLGFIVDHFIEKGART